VSSENPRVGEVDPSHVGPPDLILQEIVAPGEAPDEIRNRVANSIQTIGDRGEGWEGITWGDVAFAGRALALVDGTDEPDYDDCGDPLVWIVALVAESPVIGEAIVSAGDYTSSLGQIRFSEGKPAQHGTFRRRVSLDGSDTPIAGQAARQGTGDCQTAVNGRRRADLRSSSVKPRPEGLRRRVPGCTGRT
jgi:hypothetical protein